MQAMPYPQEAMNPANLKEKVAFQIFCALITNQRTPYDAPKVVERLMRESLSYADLWWEITKEESMKRGGGQP